MLPLHSRSTAQRRAPDLAALKLSSMRCVFADLTGNLCERLTGPDLSLEPWQIGVGAPLVNPTGGAAKMPRATKPLISGSIQNHEADMEQAAPILVGHHSPTWENHHGDL